MSKDNEGFDWLRGIDRAFEAAEQNRKEFEKLCIEPSSKVPKLGQRVLVAAGLLGMGQAWVREECVVEECGETSYKVRFLNYKPYDGGIGSLTKWVHQALITDVLGDTNAQT